MSANEIRDLKTIINQLIFLRKTVIIPWNVWQKIFIVACKRINRKKIPDPCNAIEPSQLFISNKNINSVKQSKLITYQPKTFENPNIVDIKLVITEHPKTTHKLSNTIRQAEKVGSNSSIYSDTKEK